ncbi:tryptophan synthase beta subunit-like PLP-dependent enzyme [Syncephalis plumigaleata]|nr:tryptophan synthase beta subunit-like PLP-dependent enzyme [Syncephalis plumigaleata]
MAERYYASSPIMSPRPTTDSPRDVSSSASSSAIVGANHVASSSSPSSVLQPDYLKMILTARVYDVARESPLERADNVSTRAGANIYLKREDLQPVFSFKLRGAYNCMYHLSPDEKANGVIACSAGNHAQGVALSARKMGIRATIVMPKATPDIKVRSVRRLGAEVVLYGSDFDEAKRECARLAEEQHLTNIPPFDDPYVIAGQGTVGVEILRQCPMDEQLEVIFCAVGGGGLIAGIASYIKRLMPNVKIIGVETYDANAMYQSLAAGERWIIADGTAVRQVGQETFRLCKDLLDEVVLVNTDEICAAIKDVFEDTRSIVEPSGALSLAGAKKWLSEQDNINPNGIYVSILSGANMNFDRLRFVAERAEIGEQREALISVIIPERPGSFLKLHQVIDPRQITEFSYRVTDHEKDLTEIFGALQQEGMQGLDITHDEMAKSHARFLIGGRSQVPNERLYRFVFPERPFALKKFLHGIQSEWNISLFHYRNNGGDYGHILVGIQVAPDQSGTFEQFLSQLKYPYVEETDNVVYQQFYDSRIYIDDMWHSFLLFFFK